MRFVHLLAALLVLVALYVGGYYSTVQREGTIERTRTWNRIVEVEREIGGKLVKVEERVPVTEHFKETVDGPVYRLEDSVGESTMRTLFRPMHWLDRKIRQNYWTPTPIYEFVPPQPQIIEAPAKSVTGPR